MLAIACSLLALTLTFDVLRVIILYGFCFTFTIVKIALRDHKNDPVVAIDHIEHSL